MAGDLARTSLLGRFQEAASRASLGCADDAELLRLAREAESQGVMEVSVWAYCSAAQQQASEGQFGRSYAALRLADRVTHRAGLEGLKALCTLFRTQVLQWQGFHAQALRQLLELVRSRAWQLCRPHDRAWAHYLMAELSTIDDTPDATDLCLRRARAEFSEASPRVPFFLHAAELSIGLRRYLTSGEEFEDLMRRPRVSASGRRALLQRLEVQLQDCAECPDATLYPLWLHQRDFAQKALEALRSRQAGPLHQGCEMLARLAIRTRAFDREIRWMLAAVAIEIGHAVTAQAIIAQEASPPLTGAVPPDRELAWLHLHATVQRLLGDAETALRLYRRYATHWARLAPYMLFQAAELVRALDLPAGPAAPADPPSLPPPLQRALAHMKRDPLAPLKVAALASVAGVSERTLRALFQTHLSCSPKRHLTNSRLDNVHEAVGAAAMRSSELAALARRHGFTHFGRFRQLYRERFGHYPGAAEASGALLPMAMS